MGQKTIGLLGGMSWESTAVYYRLLNQDVRKRLGGIHSARILLHSFDFAVLAELQQADDWAELASRAIDAARGLEAAGAECVLLCANTMHKVADAVSAGVRIPLLNLVNEAAALIKARGFGTVGVLGTRYTMEGDFYCGTLERKFGLSVLTPDAEDRNVVHDVIFQELAVGVINPHSRERYREIMAKLVARGAECILLACTEFGLLLRAEDCTVPLLDTTEIHATAAVDFALADAVL